MDSFISSKDFLKGTNKKGFIAILLAVVVLMSIGLVTAKREVVIAYDGKEVKVSTFATTVEDVLNKQNINIGKEDKIIPGLHEKVEKGSRIVVHRAFEVTLVDGQKEETVTTAEKTVEDLLEALDIELKGEDRVEPQLQAELSPGEKVKITRITEETLMEKQVIPFQTTIKHNDDMDHGKTRKVQEGKSGLKEVQLKITYEDGVEKAREVVGEKVLKKSTNEIIEKGTAKLLVTSRGGEPRRYKDVIIMEASAYTDDYESTGKNPGDKYFGITRSGTKVRPGVVAVDPRVIPLGSKLYIESMDRTASYGNASAEDTGGAIKGNKIDLFFESRQEALRFGRRNVKVYILD